MVELHELAMLFPVQYLVRYRHVDAMVRGYISKERALELPVRMNKLDTSYQGLCTLVNRGLTEGHLHLGGVIGAEETWADRLLGWLSPHKINRDHENIDCFILLGRIAVRLLAMGLLYQHAIPYGNPGTVSREYLPFHLIRRLDRMYMNRDLLKDPRARALLLQQWNEAFMREFQPPKNKKKDDEEQDDKEQKKVDRKQVDKKKFAKELGQVPWKQLPQLHWLLELANPGMARVWFRDRDPAHKDKSVHPSGVRQRIDLLNRLHLTAQEFLLEKDRRKDLKNNGSNRFHTPGMESWDRSPSQRVEEFISRVFTRYLIYHTHYWKQATQGGRTKGLRRFQSFYDAPERSLAV
ncbi:MAG: hypothetical protein GY940_44005, partial [bacterium]|nr:hypothetical protein [bacterium]